MEEIRNKEVKEEPTLAPQEILDMIEGHLIRAVNLLQMIKK